MPLPPLEEFVQKFLPDGVIWNDAIPNLDEHLEFLSTKIEALYRQLETAWWPRKWLRDFCIDFGEILYLERNVLHPNVPRQVIWQISSDVLGAVGIIPNGKAKYLQGLFFEVRTTPEAITAFFATYFHWS